ncbi:MAG: DNA polymerase III subunit gamma/tau [Leptospiraceae bacterium]|nr:DNA polymerase III subunit gamma/tau [Leptospiraceae bacterium]MCP5495591.1 DNA polymerase III subunit gamma/tau [Leptospiraceae bacterium]
MSDSHLVFARKYRPQIFKDVIYQELAINALKNAFKNNRVGHAYIFYGPRGVGKTTIARILAKRLNCESPQNNEPCNECTSCTEITRGISNDVLEIDAASNRGIDNIRDLRENVKFSPMGGKYKVYIIDEVHMLTEPSFNALLKTLEEPPPNVVFVMATTEYHKIPETILSRCQDFTFKKVPLTELQTYIEGICKVEKIKYDEEGLFWIAKKGDGSVRDTLSFMEQAVTFTDSNLKGDLIAEMIGYQGVDVFIGFMHEILNRDSNTNALQMIEKFSMDGVDLLKFMWDFVEFSHSSLLVKEGIASRENIQYPMEDLKKIQKEISSIDPEILNFLSNQVYGIYEKLVYMKFRNSFEMKVFLEIQIKTLMANINKPSLSGVLAKISELNELVQTEIKSLPEDSIISPQPKEPKQEKKIEQDVGELLKEQFSGVDVETNIRIPIDQ